MPEEVAKVRYKHSAAWMPVKDEVARARALPSGGTAGQVLSKASATDYDAEWTDPSGDGTWGSITGTLANQTDLQDALDAKAAASHTHGGIEVRPDYVISTTDLTDGVSELATGTLYFYYEA